MTPELEVKNALARHVREAERLEACRTALEQAKAVMAEAEARAKQTTIDLIATLWGGDIEGDRQAYLRLDGQVYDVRRIRYGSFSIERLTLL